MADAAKSTQSAHSDEKASVHSSSQVASLSKGGESLGVDEAKGRTAWRKFDWYILPIVTMFYLLSFLDRTNLGNARIAGLQRDLHLTNKQYSIALTVTYVPYIVAELPSNLLLKAVGPNLMLPTMLIGWGVITAAQGAVKSYGGLLALRFMLGLLEGGVFPGLVLYLSFFYPRRMMNTRIALFFSAATISGAFGGILAFGIVKIKKGPNGQGNWAWIFIIEGVFTIAVGLVSYFLFPRDVEACRFLNDDEKKYVRAVLIDDFSASKEDREEKFSWKEVGKAFMLPQVQALAIIFFFSGVILYSLAYFTPTLTQALGYTGSRAQLMTVPPFVVAFFLCLVIAFVSDRYNCRGYCVIFCSILCIAGFSVFLKSTSRRVRYGSLFLSIPGTYAAAPALAAWSSNNAAPHIRRATAIAIGFIMTNTGGILSTWLLGYLSLPPNFTEGITVLLAFSVGMVVVSAMNIMYLTNQNKKKAIKRAEYGNDREKEPKGLGDGSAFFVYNL